MENNQFIFLLHNEISLTPGVVTSWAVLLVPGPPDLWSAKVFECDDITTEALPKALEELWCVKVVISNQVL